ncbi:flavonol synthase flavanone 3-hydroxylase-like [Olea europaea subsp. europaea]|uniref:Flavonol synthase flavanone 3-hydroxylase-like n=1 Tax=Olea europaea subsp. europaea TaxID=158383 RepID=A0A8S0QHU1_OLEEU|nr:flavonol synthase flavanone 3-hydroxylase-like [Olea europaea subsp. europaea]
MATTPESLPENRVIDFRAPPPSPVAPGHRSSLTNDEVLTEFLENSLKVPDLILPDRVFPRQKASQNPLKLDLQSLESIENGEGLKIVEMIARVGCLEVINHGISKDFIKSVLAAGADIFGISPEKKKIAARSPERLFGFEEIHGEEEDETNEEFLWHRDEAFKAEMEGIWPIGYSNFSEKMEKLLPKIEEVASRILLFLQNISPRKFSDITTMENQEITESICYIYKHCKKMDGVECADSLKYDVIRMLIKGSEFPHALCLHLCSGSTDFHVYSKKGWASFRPEEGTIVITVGDQLQAWSNGQYRHVIGRPMFKGEDEDCISMAFLYAPPKVTNSIKDDKTISFSQQIVIAIIFTLLYQLLLRIYYMIL